MYMEQEPSGGNVISGQSPGPASKSHLAETTSAHDHALPAPLVMAEIRGGNDDGVSDHPKLATDLFLKYVRVKNVPQLNYNDFEYICHVADGGYGSVFRYRRKEDGKLVAMKFFGMVHGSEPSQQYIEQDEIVKDWELNRLRCTAKVRIIASILQLAIYPCFFFNFMYRFQTNCFVHTRFWDFFLTHTKVMSRTR